MGSLNNNFNLKKNRAMDSPAGLLTEGEIRKSQWSLRTERVRRLEVICKFCVIADVYVLKRLEHVAAEALVLNGYE